MRTCNNDKIDLRDLSLHTDYDGSFYLHAVYILENETGIYEIDIPKVRIPINRTGFDEIYGSEICDIRGTRIAPDIEIDIGYGPQWVGRGGEAAYTIRILEEKTHKLTVKDIEKKLGYKIEVVAE